MKLEATIIALAISLFFTTSAVAQNISPKIEIPSNTQETITKQDIPKRQTSKGFTLIINHRVRCFEHTTFVKLLNSGGYTLYKSFYERIDGKVSKIGGTQIWVHNKDKDYYVMQIVKVKNAVVHCVLSHLLDFVEE